MKNKGLSIVLPVYNFVVTDLVNSLVDQAQLLDILFEVRCYDDCSDNDFKEKNSSIESLENVIYKSLPKNIGRSKIRNRLANDAIYDHLLFIDGDSKIVNEDYLKNYIIKAFSHDVVIGGTIYLEKPSSPELALRWTYGKKREEQSVEERNARPYQNFTINNLFIKKDLFLNNLLDEGITTYGHEDTKLGYELKANNIDIQHIKNPVEHIGLESNEAFLLKTQESVKNLYSLSSKESIGIDSKLFHYFSLLKSYSLTKIFHWTYKILTPRIEKNLRSGSPTLFYFDLYKLNLILIEDRKQMTYVN